MQLGIIPWIQPKFIENECTQWIQDKVIVNEYIQSFRTQCHWIWMHSMDTTQSHRIWMHSLNTTQGHWHLLIHSRWVWWMQNKFINTSFHSKCKKRSTWAFYDIQAIAIFGWLRKGSLFIFGGHFELSSIHFLQNEHNLFDERMWMSNDEMFTQMLAAWKWISFIAFSKSTLVLHLRLDMAIHKLYLFPTHVFYSSNSKSR